MTQPVPPDMGQNMSQGNSRAEAAGERGGHGRTAETFRREAVSDSIWAKRENLESSEQAWVGDGGGEHYPALVLSYELSGCLA